MSPAVERLRSEHWQLCAPLGKALLLAALYQHSSSPSVVLLLHFAPLPNLSGHNVHLFRDSFPHIQVPTGQGLITLDCNLERQQLPSEFVAVWGEDVNSRDWCSVEG